MQANAPKKRAEHGLENLAARYQAARQFIEESGVHIKHFRPRLVTDYGVVGSHNGGLTVAYRQLPSDSFVEIATTICSPRDGYHRKVGTALAVEQFANLHRIRVPAYGLPAHEVVENLFREHTTFEPREVN